MPHFVHRAVALTTAVVSSLVLAAAAQASITPSVSLDQSAGKAAGSTANLGLDLKFTNTGTDSAHNLTINLPPGLLANASINGGSCLKTTNTSGTACEVGSGTVTAIRTSLVLGLPAGIQVPVTFYLVPPPKAGDLAGLTVIGNVLGLNEQLGSTGEIKVRPDGGPQRGRRDHQPRPARPAHALGLHRTGGDDLRDRDQEHVSRAALPGDLSGDAGQAHRVRRLLQRCNRPHGQRAAVGDRVLGPVLRPGVQGHGDPRQRRPAGQARDDRHPGPPRGTESLGVARLPDGRAGPQPRVDQGALPQPRLGHMSEVGSASATSPLYPSTLTGAAYLTGYVERAVAHARVPLALPAHPDRSRRPGQERRDVRRAARYPVDQPGGEPQRRAPRGCSSRRVNAPSGTATATLTDQNGDKTVKAPANFAVVGCPGTSSSSGSGGSGRRPVQAARPGAAAASTARASPASPSATRTSAVCATPPWPPAIQVSRSG